MADFFQTIIDTGVGLGAADHVARHAVSFLAERGIIEGHASEDGGYARGPRALEICGDSLGPAAHESIPPVYTHLQVMVGRSTHSQDLSESRPPSPRCPRCSRALVDPDDEWRAAVQGWLSGDDESPLGCPACGSSVPVAGWDYGSGFGFGNLAFRFWNWPPLTPAFVEEFRGELGHPIWIVRGRL